jgi:hypothetical protein
MSRVSIPQDVALRLQLAAIAGNEPATSYFEIRSKRASGPGMQQDFIPIQELDRAARSAINRGQMTDTYVGAAPRTQRKGSTDAIERVWCLWADGDGPSALDRLRDMRPMPSIVIRTGSENHAHAYWPLRGPTPPDWAQRANRRLALALGADEKATDPARILRASGTLSHKSSPPRPVVCTRLELDAFTLDQVVGHLPDDPRYLTPSRCIREPIATDPSSLVDGLARTVREAQVGNRNAVLFWAACRIRERTELGQLDDDQAREALRDSALAAGLGEQETDRTLDSALDTRVAA